MNGKWAKQITSLPLRECGLKSLQASFPGRRLRVTPLAGVWIEMSINIELVSLNRVTPLAGVWIEIFHGHGKRVRKCHVTPLAGVWIEMYRRKLLQLPVSVTPLAGVWIEIKMAVRQYVGARSLPLRECGLKFPEEW